MCKGGGTEGLEIFLESRVGGDVEQNGSFALKISWTGRFRV